MFQNAWSKFFGKKEVRIVMVGLDAAGKTTVLNKLKFGEVVMTVPTIGFNVESIEYKNLQMQVWDIGGQDKIRPLWRHYYQGTNAVIFVIDSNDAERMSLAREELESMLQFPELRDAKLLVYANKQDLKGAISTKTVAKALDLSSLKTHEWYVQGTSATAGQGLIEGLDWLADAIQRQSKAGH